MISANRQLIENADGTQEKIALVQKEGVVTEYSIVHASGNSLKENRHDINI